MPYLKSMLSKVLSELRNGFIPHSYLCRTRIIQALQKRRNFRAFLQILSRRIGIRLRSPLQQIIENIGVVVAGKSDGAFLG